MRLRGSSGQKSGNDGGSFCPNCDVVVLDRNVFAAHISHATRHSAALQCTVAGIVDHMPLLMIRRGPLLEVTIIRSL